jgi:hypothetical protein
MNIDRMQRVEKCLRNYAIRESCWEVDMNNWNCCALGVVIKEKLFKEIEINTIYNVGDIAHFLGIDQEEFHYVFGSPKYGEATGGKAALLERADRIRRMLNTYVTVEKLKEIKIESLEDMEV